MTNLDAPNPKVPTDDIETRLNSLQHTLSQLSLQPPRCLWLKEVDSTNQFLQRLDISPSETVLLIADQQTQGKGQAGRVWQSPEGNLYLSACLPTKTPLQGRLALEAALAIVQIPLLCSLIGLGVKWPNDLYHQQGGQLRKFGGILIEAKSAQQVIVGVGINLTFMQSYVHDQSVTDLSSLLHTPVSPAALASQIYLALVKAVQQFDQHSPQLPARFTQSDLMANQAVQVTLPNQRLVIGRADGVAADGALRVISSEGLQLIYSGQLRRIFQGH
jgi:BirA family transcriptional regulator, biotin operon repressor / biotin---[acetyl-CoA-carboxylase] ligase